MKSSLESFSFAEIIAFTIYETAKKAKNKSQRASGYSSGKSLPLPVKTTTSLGIFITRQKNTLTYPDAKRLRIEVSFASPEEILAKARKKIIINAIAISSKNKSAIFT
jgi:hypothetical protein